MTKQEFQEIFDTLCRKYQTQLSVEFFKQWWDEFGGLDSEKLQQALDNYAAQEQRIIPTIMAVRDQLRHIHREQHAEFNAAYPPIPERDTDSDVFARANIMCMKNLTAKTWAIPDAIEYLSQVARERPGLAYSCDKAIRGLQEASVESFATRRSASLE